MTNLLEKEFPLILEKGRPKAFVVDVKVFQGLRIILDNLLNREPELENVLLETSKAFQRLMSSVEKEDSKPSSDWRKELYEL
ncbi:hypothetical protein KKG61_04280 [bacterium]|nr:hypothetical protein [bacterium]MBU1599306.1 hypothetical protein [bacterium]MBU2462369.1 hypothetical protein [bacterium]